MELKEHFKGKIFQLISETADELGLECYVVGGYVRDIFLNRPSKDIDVVVVGSGIEIAQAFGKKLGKGAHVSVFRNFGTAQVKYRDTEVEFVGARKESYSHDSRKPVVENGTLEEAWGCGTAAVVSPIGELAKGEQKTTISGGKIGELTQKLYDALTAIQWGKAEDKFDWCHKVI